VIFPECVFNGWAVITPCSSRIPKFCHPQIASLSRVIYDGFYRA
jgi:hypothetical protein